MASRRRKRPRGPVVLSVSVDYPDPSKDLSPERRQLLEEILDLLRDHFANCYDTYNRCPYCRADRHAPHEQDCRLQLAIAKICATLGVEVLPYPEPRPFCPRPEDPRRWQDSRLLPDDSDDGPVFEGQA